ncbi:OLC1v1017418C2 [Oldenlandia corymbosa var. corymbosa]|uniref:OLC1v1017418C2 n=1 Tax=Oldenlandia corymbosa var. corymbosa TaxID=529605 RepID=A0AAV1E9H9_OLDCO|nr:OLC1v1017418C2 [Oldenlandia corymbosa var. corymbosa]
MVNDAAFRSSLACLAVVLVIVGIWTQSFKKVVATYIFGMFAIGGVILPDWEFFDRSVSQWCTPLAVGPHHLRSPPNQSTSSNRWWMYVSS